MKSIKYTAVAIRHYMRFLEEVLEYTREQDTAQVQSDLACYQSLLKELENNKWPV